MDLHPIPTYPTRLPVWRWAEVISRTPCGTGVNTITATIMNIDGVGGTLGRAGPTSIYTNCPVSRSGFDNESGCPRERRYEFPRLEYNLGVRNAFVATGSVRM